MPQCVNCNGLCDNKNKISCQLQYKFRDTDKVQVKIADAIEELFDSEVTKDQLRKYGGCIMCKDCHSMLREAITRKWDVEECMINLHDRIDQVTTNTREQFYKESKETHKAGRCWGCMLDFTDVKQRKKRQKLSNLLFKEMTILEGIETLLEEEAATLHGLVPKKTFLCNTCYILMRNVVRHQCDFETAGTSFKWKTSYNSVLACLKSGATPCGTVPNARNSKKGKKRKGNATKDIDKVTRNSTCISAKRLRLETDKTGHVETKATVTDENVSISSENCEDDVDDDANFTVRWMFNKTSNTKLKAKKSTNCSSESVGDKNDECIVEENKTNSIEEREIPQSFVDLDHAYGLITNRDDKLYLDKDLLSKEDLPVLEDSLDKTKDVKKPIIHIRLDSRKDLVVSSITSPNLDHTLDERAMSSEEWVLYYYPSFAGRAEFVRLVFEETGVPYRECGETFLGIRQLINQGQMEGYPHFAPPMVKKGDFQLSQTPVICRYLGEEFGLYPETKEDKLHAEQINVCCHDYIAEGRLAFHGINPVGPYLSQKEETQPYIDRFVKERLPLWLKYFERVLKANSNETGFLYGSKICYVDLALFHILRATEHQFPAAYQSADYMPLLKAFKERIASRERISAYLKSDRCQGLSDNSMM